MEYVFYLVILVAFVYVTTGIVQSTLFSATEIPRSELPTVVERERQALFPEFLTQAIRKQKSRHRYQLDGRYADKPGQLVFALTPESELSILEFTQLGKKHPFRKLRTLSNVEVPAKIADALQPFLADDSIQFESGKVELGLIEGSLSYRIQVQSQDYRYHFDVSESGELYQFSRKEAA